MCRWWWRRILLSRSTSLLIVSTTAMVVSRTWLGFRHTLPSLSHHRGRERPLALSSRVGTSMCVGNECWRMCLLWERFTWYCCLVSDLADTRIRPIYACVVRPSIIYNQLGCYVTWNIWDMGIKEWPVWWGWLMVWSVKCCLFSKRHAVHGSIWSAQPPTWSE